MQILKDDNLRSVPTILLSQITTFSFVDPLRGLIRLSSSNQFMPLHLLRVLIPPKICDSALSVFEVPVQVCVHSKSKLSDTSHLLPSVLYSSSLYKQWYTHCFLYFWLFKNSSAKKKNIEWSSLCCCCELSFLFCSIYVWKYEQTSTVLTVNGSTGTITGWHYLSIDFITARHWPISVCNVYRSMQ